MPLLTNSEKNQNLAQKNENFLKNIFGWGEKSSYKCIENAVAIYYNWAMIVLIGASASGKTEIAKRLGILFGIKKAVTHTTRSPRVGERNHVDYHFVSQEEFLRLKKEDAFVETTYYNGNYYGCSKAEIGVDKVVIVDPSGLLSFLALKDKSIITFLLSCDEKTRKERMEKRLDDAHAIESRLENDRVAFAKENVAPTDFEIDTSDKGIDELTKLIYDLYKEEYEKRIN